MTVTETAAASAQVLTFDLGTEQYCVGIDTVAEIVAPDEITGLPETPPAVAGVMDLRGEMTTIVRPAVVFDVSTSGDTQQVLVFEDETDRVGWLVDHVHEVRAVADLDREAVADNAYLDGLVSDDDGFTIWVDPAAVHSSLPV